MEQGVVACRPWSKDPQSQCAASALPAVMKLSWRASMALAHVALTRLEGDNGGLSKAEVLDKAEEVMAEIKAEAGEDQGEKSVRKRGRSGHQRQRAAKWRGGLQARCARSSLFKLLSARERTCLPQAVNRAFDERT